MNKSKHNKGKFCNCTEGLYTDPKCARRETEKLSIKELSDN